MSLPFNVAMRLVTKYGICLFRMTESEAMQFFQFDQEGNMYVFAPGAGCTGPTHLVRPGDELSFNSTYNASDWATENSVKTGYDDAKLANTCPGSLE